MLRRRETVRMRRLVMPRKCVGASVISGPSNKKTGILVCMGIQRAILHGQKVRASRRGEMEKEVRHVKGVWEKVTG